MKSRYVILTLAREVDERELRKYGVNFEADGASGRMVINNERIEIEEMYQPSAELSANMDLARARGEGRR